MQIKIVGKALVITSSVKKAVIEKAAKLVKSSLTLYKEVNGEQEPVCSIGIGKVAGINSNGITFDSANKDGFAQATIVLPDMKAEERKAYVEDNFGLTLVNASVIEGQLETALADRAATLSTIMDNVEVE
jgi:hypothetical protein